MKENRELPSGSGDEARHPGRRPTLVMLVGLPGTGKSTLARKLATRTPLSIVQSDEIRRQLFANPTYSPQENGRVFSWVHRQIDRLLREGRDVLFDATNLAESNRRRAYRIAEQAGARVLILRTVAAEEVVAGRLRKRGDGIDPQDRSEANWDVYLRMKAEYQEIGRPYLQVDTSQDLEPVIEAIVERLRGES